MATEFQVDRRRRVEALQGYYLTAGTLISHAFQARVRWIKALDEVIDEFAKNGVSAGTVKASLVGAQYNSIFERYSEAMTNLKPPAGSEDYHQCWLSWLKRLTRTNFCLSEGAARRDFKLLEEACSELEEARPLLVTVTRVTHAVAPELLPTEAIPVRSGWRAAPPPPAPAPAAEPAPEGKSGLSGVRVAAKATEAKGQKRKPGAETAQAGAPKPAQTTARPAPPKRR